MKNKSNYYATSDEYLAKGLALIGFDYRKYEGTKYGTTYTFIRCDELFEAIRDLRDLRNKYNKFNK